ncbi:hypothetical protein Dsin_016192 [Dipteronia sinensis]|uniref:Uncharacterized protein n=1 Tax=Dipteronia sinensis TaxID=43782 RepID=A0AAE0AD95_9ROSI|nr:hypothetical protein Dsin_016192 [Dipteronia sinensis]
MLPMIFSKNVDSMQYITLENPYPIPAISFAKILDMVLLVLPVVYGQSFANKAATGRCSDGLLIIDYFDKKIVNPVTKASLDKQLDWMCSYFNSVCSNNKEEKNKNSLFMVGEIGGNGYNYAVFQANLVPIVVNSIKDAVTKVIWYGATRVIVPGNFPNGCFPIYLTGFRTNDNNAYDECRCLKELNNFSIFHNDHLEQAIQEL